MKRDDQPLHMWSYWRDKEGALAAAREYFPNQVENNKELQRAVAQAETALRAIDSIISQLEDDQLMKEIAT